MFAGNRQRMGVGGSMAAMAGLAALLSGGGISAQQIHAVDAGSTEKYAPIPGFDTTSIDTGVDPCTDFYKFACGKFVANHPIPADQTGVDQFYALYNVNTQALKRHFDERGRRGSWPKCR